MCEFAREPIPDCHFLYYRISKSVYDHMMKRVTDTDRQISSFPPNLFRSPTGGPLSADWCKYRCPIDTLNAVPECRKGRYYGIVQFPVGEIREAESCNVIHNPDDNNQAHSSIIGDEGERRYKLRKCAEWVMEFTLA